MGTHLAPLILMWSKEGLVWSPIFEAWKSRQKLLSELQAKSSSNIWNGEKQDFQDFLYSSSRHMRGFRYHSDHIQLKLI